MHYMVCSICGCSKKVNDYQSLAQKDLVCGVCGIAGIEKYRVFDDHGNLIKDVTEKIDDCNFNTKCAANSAQQLKQPNSIPTPIPLSLPPKQTDDKKIIQKWEYKVIDIDGRSGPRSSRASKAQVRSEMMNYYGQQGWEFIQECDSLLYFKRPL